MPTGRGSTRRTAAVMNLDENIWERLRTPQRALVVSFPFRRDDYSTVDTVLRLSRAASPHDGADEEARASTPTSISAK